LLSKLKKTAALLKNEQFKEYVPQTFKMSKATLFEALHTHHMVYIKPDSGMHGIGVIRVEWKNGEIWPYSYQTGLRIYQFSNFPSLYESLRERIKSKSYLVQRGIHLLKYRDRPFDIRVMVQRNKKSHWETTGMIGRVAAPGKIVTNYHSGGMLVSVEKLLSSHLSNETSNRYVRQLGELGRRAALQLARMYPGLREIGLDIALDNKYHPWILEVNTSPDPYIFRSLKNKKIYEKVIRYHRLNSVSKK
jgi:glutathione synthase/RimK-type ligase-like ATP-grasp enzyme